MTPLSRIKNWFLELEVEYQNEIAALSGHFHFDERIDKEFGQDAKRNLFIEYLDDTSIDKIEHVRRTLFVTKLLDFSFSGRDTESGWTETLDRLLAIRSKQSEENRETTWIDSVLDTHHERKDIWLEICNSWNTLKDNFLTDRQVTDWYFFDVMR